MCEGQEGGEWGRLTQRRTMVAMILSTNLGTLGPDLDAALHNNMAPTFKSHGRRARSDRSGQATAPTVRTMRELALDTVGDSCFVIRPLESRRGKPASSTCVRVRA